VGVQRFKESGTESDAQVFLFADLAGFTALTDAHGDEQAADLVDEFTRATMELLPAHEAELVKTIGDALMLRVPEPAEAVKLGLALTGEILAEHGYPAVRVGMHYGPAVHRGGDWFGAAVNLAARISGLAAGGEVLISEATRSAAAGVEHVQFHDRGNHRVRNLTEPVHIFAAARENASDGPTLIDPVCRMAIDPRRAAGTLIHEGVEYHFCSLRCAERFATAPGDYATS
jgi:adenylate cyclase